MASLRTLDSQEFSNHVPIKLTLRQDNAQSHKGPAALSSIRLQDEIRAYWLATLQLMQGQRAHAILGRCTPLAKKIVRNWEIREARR